MRTDIDLFIEFLSTGVTQKALAQKHNLPTHTLNTILKNTMIELKSTARSGDGEEFFPEYHQGRKVRYPWLSNRGIGLPWFNEYKDNWLRYIKHRKDAAQATREKDMRKVADLTVDELLDLLNKSLNR